MKLKGLLVQVLAGLFLAISASTFAGQMERLTERVNAGGGKIYSVPNLEVLPTNFGDFPEAFATGVPTWDNDMIDVDKLDPGQNGAGVYVAVLDTGLAANWRDYFPEERIATELGRGFTDDGVMQAIRTGMYSPRVSETSNFIGEHPHGTHVSSTVIGYSINGTSVPGVAPMAKIIPVKVLTTYQGIRETFGTDASVAAGISYIGDLASVMPDSRFVINMSLGSLSVISDIEADAIDYAISAGVIVVASAGNNGPEGMGSPGSYAPVISVGSTGWALDAAACTGEWVVFAGGCIINGAFWWQDVPEDDSDAQSYVSEFSSRSNPGNPDVAGSDQELDVIAPGSWVVGPYPVGIAQSHLPWWSNGNGNGVDGQYFFVGGTSMASPHVAGVAALMVQADPTLVQADVEALLKATTDIISQPAVRLRAFPASPFVFPVEWGFDGLDAVGAGLVQADAAVTAATP